MWGESLLARGPRQLRERAAATGLKRLADQVRAQGSQPLEIVLPGGERFGFGAEPRIRMTVRDEAGYRLLLQPTIANLAQAFVEAAVDLDGDLIEATAVGEALARAAGAPVSSRERLVAARHRPGQDRVDIEHHYDVGNDFYRLWLDEQMVYSCAYFKTGDEDIDTAQRDKLDHICRKLRLAPGQRLLDVGCGWGALIVHAARHYGVDAVGITLSQAQLDVARRRIAAAGLSGRVQARLLDYRDLNRHFEPAAFDRVVSVGMFEHVGINRLPAYFGTIATLLRERGLLLNHGITSSDVDNRPVGSGIGDFINDYVFPNGELPHLALAVREIAAAGFEVADVEGLRPHYALTLKHWSQRLEARLEAARELIDERRLRVWRLYLAGCSYGFAQGWINIYQVLASKQAVTGATELPLTRDWIYAADVQAP